LKAHGPAGGGRYKNETIMWVMFRSDRLRWLSALGAVLLAAGVLGPGSIEAAALPAEPAVVSPPAEESGSSRPDGLRRLHAYRATLDGFLPLYQRDVLRASDRAEAEAAVGADDSVAEGAWRALARARSVFLEFEARVLEADRLIAEALALEALASARPIPPPVLIHSHGTVRWSLALTPRLRRFFASRFGRPLPISAFGQTAVHDRMAFDHRDALDVAVHPDSFEGRALIAFLRKSGLPFLAFRGAVAGAATGAHVHIGAASLPLRAGR
jgi:hypothetical protein